jgi:hypothetical protein|tara:strand:+ start:85 stop:507 length:423 start_codon:yes stop_codon:yes gene_type:complete
MSKIKMTEQILLDVCNRLAIGDTLTGILRSDKNKFPSKQAFYNGLRSNEEWRNKYNEARVDQAQHFFDKIVNEAEALDDKNLNHAQVNAKRVKIDALKWAAARLSPMDYADKLNAKVSGTGPNGALVVKWADADDNTKTK